MKNTMRKQSPLNFKVRVKTASGGTTSLRDAIAAKRAKSTGETSIKTKTLVAKPTQETSIKTKAPATKPTTETSVKTKAPAKKPAPVEGKPNKSSVRTDPSRVVGRKEGKVADAATREAAIKARGGVLLQSKKSPMKQGFFDTNPAMAAVKKATELAASAKAKKEATTKSAPATKPAKPTAPEGKPNASAKPVGKKAVETVKKVAATAAKGAAVKTALMQLKKHKK